MSMYDSDYKCLEKLGFEITAMDTINATVRSSATDLTGCKHARFVFAITHKTALDASNYLTITFEECATTGGSYTAIDTARYFLIESSSSVTSQPLTDLGHLLFTVTPSLPFVKMVITKTGTINVDGIVICEKLNWEVKNI